jgi:hypothetical protein
VVAAVVSEPPAADSDTALLFLAASLIEFHAFGANGLCIGCLEQWNRLVPYPCTQVAWAVRVLGAHGFLRPSGPASNSDPDQEESS